MKWYYRVAGGHTHVRVFMNGGKCGDLSFRNEEFEVVKRHEDDRVESTSGYHPSIIEFINETE